MAWPEQLVTLLQYPASIILLMLLLERVLVWSPLWHPLSLVRLFAQQLQLRVLRPQRDAPGQQLLAGVLATLVLLTLVLFPAWWLLDVSDFPSALGAFLLLISLHTTPQTALVKAIAKALQRDQKNVARTLLNRLDSRDNKRLSPIGIIRAAADNQLLSWVQHTFAIVLAYLIGGAVLALAVRVLTLLASQWPLEDPRYRYFGQIPRRLSQLVLLLPMLLAALLVILLSTLVRGPRLLRTLRQQQWQHWWLPEACWLFGCARLLGIPLGGPVQYRNERTRRARFGPAVDNPKAILFALRFTRIADALVLLTLLAFAALQLL